ncbi:MAG: hypothetical protein OQK24_06670 [Magnetovibrio sp.]|nr:hypothetical protein [Magnetovibrio sp.]
MTAQRFSTSMDDSDYYGKTDWQKEKADQEQYVKDKEARRNERREKTRSLRELRLSQKEKRIDELYD